MFAFYSLILFFLFLSKEYLSYGEERLIVFSYLILLFLGFFFLSSGFNSAFDDRIKIIKLEFENLFNIILDILLLTQELIKKYYLISVYSLKLYISIFNEFFFYFLNISSFKYLKVVFFNLKLSNMLNSSLIFYKNLLNIIYINFFTKYVLKNIIWFSTNNLVWQRTENIEELVNNFSITSNTNVEDKRLLNENDRIWFISMPNYFQIKKNFGYRFSFSFKSFNLEIYKDLK